MSDCKARMHQIQFQFKVEGDGSWEEISPF